MFAKASPKLSWPNMSCSGECHCKIQAKNDTANETNSMKDDVWGSDEENISAYADLQRAHVNQGYLDGITRAQESGLQDGFDKGFPQGGGLGMRVGKILAKLHGTSRFDEAKQALKITQVLDKKYFDNQLDLQSSQHSLITHWEEIADIETTT
ncbi:hypothetical protein JCM33374_g6357 [Metschnikowia sp. JCM 33374]|nr:hypothetical protein JCM33374_g6357 [Metschnikowia sp. JCM 33374]